MFLAHPETEDGLDQRGEAHAWIAEEARRVLGVEQSLRAQARLAQADQVLRGGVQNPLGVAESLVEL